MSLVEAVTNVVVGFAVALLTQIIVFPLFGLQVSLTENLIIGAAFTGISLPRSYVLRRLFEAIRVRGAVQKAHASGRLVLHGDGSIDVAALDARRAQATHRRMPLTATPTVYPACSCTVAAVILDGRPRGLKSRRFYGGLICAMMPSIDQLQREIACQQYSYSRGTP